MLDVSHDGVDPHVRTSSSFPLTPSPCSAAGAEGGSLSPEELAEVFSESPPPPPLVLSGRAASLTSY